MQKHSLLGSFGHEKFAFLYAVVSVAVIGIVMTYSWIAGLAWWQTVLMLVGLLVGALATLFSLLEIRRIAQRVDRGGEALQEEANPYPPRAVSVAPPTGDPCPHHEDYTESQGLDQGQLTAHLPDATPFVDKLMSRKKPQETPAGR
jgi:hypothetical protein